MSPIRQRYGRALTDLAIGTEPGLLAAYRQAAADRAAARARG